MSRYNTQNPIESDDVRDMSDNAKNLDLLSNSSGMTFDDRFGVERKTIHGMNSEFDSNLASMNSEFDSNLASMNSEFDSNLASMNSEFDSQILNMGFTRIGTFASGATLTNPRQTLLWDIADGGDGQEYGWSGTFAPHGKIVPPLSDPNSAGGIAVGAWISRFDPELRIQVREALRRSYAEAGYNVVGTFQAGFTIVNVNDIGIDEVTGKGYTGPAGFVAAGTDPASGGFVDRSAAISITFSTVTEMLAATWVVSGQRVRWLGYYEPSDGGGNWGTVRFGPHVADGGSIFSISPTLYVEANLKGKRVNVRKFGARAVADGTLYDCIAQIRACESYVRAAPNPSLQQTMYFPCGKYGISDTWHIDDTMDFNLYFDNVYFVSMATTPKDAMILCTDWVQSQMLGAVRFDNTRDPLYAKFYCGLSVQPLTKGSTKNAFYNVKALWFPCGLKVGEDTNDLACSEQTFYNYSQYECLRAFEGAGLQSGASFVGCNLLATPSPVLTGPIHAMWLKGGFWTVVGGEVLTTQSVSNQCIRMNPCKGATPTYPQVRINGVILETASPMVLIDNPEGILLDRSQQPGQLQIQGSGGYCGADAIKNSTFIDAADDYYGVIQIKNNNLYAAVLRPAFNISAGPVARIDVDETSFGVGFRDRIGGVNGGILIHPDMLVAVAYNSAGSTYTAGVKQTIKFATKSPWPRYRRYNEFFNLATGLYTVPQGGHKSLKVDCSIVAAGLNGDFFVEVDGNVVQFGQIVGDRATVSSAIENLVGGQTVGVYLQIGSGSVTLKGGRFTNINFTISN